MPEQSAYLLQDTCGQYKGEHIVWCPTDAQVNEATAMARKIGVEPIRLAAYQMLYPDKAIMMDKLPLLTKLNVIPGKAAWKIKVEVHQHYSLKIGTV